MSAISRAAKSELDHFIDGLKKRNPGESEFHQAVEEVAETIMPFVLENTQYKDAQILERMTEPDRIIVFRVTWEDDEGHIRANRAWRVQFNNAIGPYKGGLRFHPSVTQSVLKFLGFEQVFKNSLTGLPMGGAKGGSNFNPKGKSDREVMRFCQSLMSELHRHIGEDTDIPAGDIGVGAREISYMFGQYKRLENRFVGTLTGKGLAFGGSLVRTEATGYGAVYFMQNMLAKKGDGLEGKKVVVSGSGNVATFCIEKSNQLGAKVLACSDSGGSIYDPDGIDDEKLAFIKDLKDVRRGRISEYAEKFPNAEFRAGKRPWDVPCDLAFPCATQNELDGDDAKTLIANGCQAVGRGSEYAQHLGRSPSLFGRQVSLRACESCERRRRCGLWIGTGAELDADRVEPRRSRGPVGGHHEGHPRPVRRAGARVRRFCELRERRQHRGLRESCRRHDSLRRCLTGLNCLVGLKRPGTLLVPGRLSR